MIIFTLVFIAFLAGIVLQSLRRNENKIRRPPGPGNFCTSVLTFLRAFVHPSLGRYFTKLGKTYGPLTYVRLGPFKVILVNGTEALREVCKIPALNGRIDCMFKDIMGHQGILWTDNTSQNRKFFFRNTRHFGLGAASAENNIHEEITHLFKYFDSFGGKACSVKGAYNISTLNGIIHRFMGEKVSQDDPQLKSIVDRLHVLVEAPGIMKACIFVPSLTKWIPWSLSGRNFMEKVFRDGLDIAYPILQNRFKSRIPNQPRDLADALMDEVEETTDSNSIFHISKDPIRPLFFDMFTAAIETTSSMLEWTIFYLTQFPQVQGKLQEEVDTVIGTEALPEILHRLKMPYFQAFLQEIFRVAPVIPFWYHMAIEDSTFRGYPIEKGTYFIGNFFGAHMDPDLWENPKEFKPERFLNENGEFIKSENLFTFGSGKRSCIGEVTARDQLFLNVARQVQTYTVSSETKLKSLEGSMAIGYHPPEFKVSFVRRC